jgi:hypothetical protein
MLMSVAKLSLEGQRGNGKDSGWQMEAGDHQVLASMHTDLSGQNSGDVDGPEQNDVNTRLSLEKSETGD